MVSQTSYEFGPTYSLFNWINPGFYTMIGPALTMLFEGIKGLSETLEYTKDTLIANYTAPMVSGEIRETERNLPDWRKSFPGYSDERVLAAAYYAKVGNLVQYAPDTATIHAIPWQNRTSEDTIKRGVGVCSDKAILFVSFLRGSGIKARVIEGRYERASGTGGAHGWVEAFIDGEWVLIDPTSHVQFNYWFSEKAKEDNKTYKKVAVSDLGSGDPFYLNL